MFGLKATKARPERQHVIPLRYSHASEHISRVGILLLFVCASCVRARSVSPAIASEFLECRFQPSGSEKPEKCAGQSACIGPDWLRVPGTETECKVHLCGRTVWSVWCYISPATEHNAELIQEAMTVRFGVPLEARKYLGGCAREYEWNVALVGATENNVNHVSLYSEPIEASGCLNSTFQLRVNIRRFDRGDWDEMCPCAEPGESIPDYLW